MQQAIQALLNLKVMVVTHARSTTYNTKGQGQGRRTQMRLSQHNNNNNNNKMRADLASTTDFITAGSVVPFVTPENPWWFGQTIIGTRTGPAVTVSAPRSGFCYYFKGTTNKVQPYTGSGMSCRGRHDWTGGLFFSPIPDLCRYFMAQPTKFRTGR